jgi:thioredoxin-like negative regulator of GroEL
MAGLTAILVLNHALLTANPANYQTARADAEANHRPLLVLVGADWCPGCRTMKDTVLPALARRGALRAVSFAAVDADAEAETARELMRGSAIPQLIVFSRSADGRWHREQITGSASEREVQSLVARAIQVQHQAAHTSSSAIGN